MTSPWGRMGRDPGLVAYSKAVLGEGSQAEGPMVADMHAMDPKY